MGNYYLNFIIYLCVKVEFERAVYNLKGRHKGQGAGGR